MENVGKIYKIVDEKSGYIIDDNGEKYLFFKSDILDDTKMVLGNVVLFKPIKDYVLRAVLISKYEEN